MEAYDASAHRPLVLDCGHTLCTACVATGHGHGGMRTCPTCRHLVTRAASELSPNYALLEAIEIAQQKQQQQEEQQQQGQQPTQEQQQGIAASIRLLERIGITGARRLVLEPDSVTLVREISTVGSMGVVWEGDLDGEKASPWMKDRVGVV